MIYTITFSPSIDYTMNVPSFELQKINRSESQYETIGGKGVNVSSVLHNLHTDSLAMGFVAGDIGNLIKMKLDKVGIKHNFIEISGESRINVKINSQGETAINGNGPCPTKDEFDKLLNMLSSIDKDDVVIMSGSVPKGMPKDSYGQIMEALKDINPLTVCDVTGTYLKDCLKYSPFLIKPNIDELEETLGLKINSFDEIKGGARKLQELGAKNVIVSMGDKGAYLLDEFGNEHMVKSLKVKVLTTVGAGDSLVAGFIKKYLETHQYEESLAYGVLVASATVNSGKLATEESIRHVIEQNL